MNSFFQQLFDTSDFPARWTCGQWSPAHGWLHILADVAIFGAYAAIPLALAYFIRRRKDVPFIPIFWLFALFIFSCGFGHLVEATLFWNPWYRLSGAVKVVTAVVSWLTVIQLVKVVPDALALPGLASVNRQLKQEMAERARVEDQLRASLREVNHLKAALDEHAIVAITDQQGKITFVNDKFCAISQYAREDLLGQDHRIINSGHHSKEFMRDLWSIIGRGKVWKGEIKNRAKDGSYYWVDTTIVPFLNAEGKPVEFVAIRADITAHKVAEERLQDSLAEKNTLLQEVHHRVKNNLQIISSLLNLQAGYIQHPEALAAFGESRLRVQSMALVHEKLYQSRSLSELDFAQYTKILVDNLFRSFGADQAAVRARIEVDPVKLDLNMIIPCALILNELVSNSLKYAFPQGRAGEILVLLHRRPDGHFRLVVSDDGVGLPAEFNVSRASTLGLQLVNTLVGQLHGALEIDTQGVGAGFAISFPDVPDVKMIKPRQPHENPYP